jgi:acyl-coenzyme A synthetase/AMP-(fatty) acid ligase
LEVVAQQHKNAIPGLATFEIASSESLFDIHSKRKEVVKPYPYKKTWEEAHADPFLILHTSGSTGPPKPITLNPGYIGALDSFRLIPDVNGHKTASPALLAGKVTYLGVPNFHLGGLVFSIPSLFYDSTTLLGPVSKPASAEILAQLMRATKVQAIVGVPSLLENLVKDHGHDFKELCRDLELVLYTGGPISQAAGDFIVANAQAELSQTYGSTETSACHILMPRRENWAAFNFHPTHGPEFEKVDSEDGGDVYEVVVKRRDDILWAQSVFMIFPHLKEWRTKDLFRREEEGIWVFQGRTDDVINLKGPGKVNPVALESRIQSLPGVSGAIVFGNGRVRCGMIVETKDHDMIVPEAVWDMVQKENENMPEHARIDRHMILLAKKEKPFVRAGKGTVVRSQSLKEYEAEIEGLYRNEE